MRIRRREAKKAGIKNTQKRNRANKTNRDQSQTVDKRNFVNSLFIFV